MANLQRVILSSSARTQVFNQVSHRHRFFKYNYSSGSDRVFQTPPPNVKFERKASHFVRFCAFWLRLSGYVGGLILFGSGAIFIYGAVSPVLEKWTEKRDPLDPTGKIDPEDVNGVIDMAVQMLISNEKQSAIVGEIKSIAKEALSIRGHSQKPKITWIHDENDKRVEKIISAAIEGSTRSAVLETTLQVSKINDDGQGKFDDENGWRLKSVNLKVNGTKYNGQIFPSISDL